MLSGLRHDGLVRGDDQKAHVDAADASQHVVDEALVAGNVDDADLVAAGQLKPGEAQVDGHAALFFLAQAVRVNACERLDERGLAVVDVTCRSDYKH